MGDLAGSLNILGVLGIRGLGGCLTLRGLFYWVCLVDLHVDLLVGPGSLPYWAVPYADCSGRKGLCVNRSVLGSSRWHHIEKAGRCANWGFSYLKRANLSSIDGHYLLLLGRELLILSWVWLSNACS